MVIETGAIIVLCVLAVAMAVIGAFECLMIKIRKLESRIERYEQYITKD